MRKNKFGRTVRVRTPYDDEVGYIDEFWITAIDNDDDSIDKVRIASGSSSDIAITIVGRLGESTLDGENLDDGKVRHSL